MLEHLDPGFLRKREDNAATRGFFGGLLLGILAGVVLTLVFTPRRGEETRAAVTEVAEEIKARASNLLPHRESQDAELNLAHGHEVAIEREITVGDTAPTQVDHGSQEPAPE